MSGFVLDNSVVMRWVMASPKASDQKYAASVLKALSDNDALVPNLWHLEASNVIVGAEKRGELKPGESENFIAQLENLPIHVDDMTAHQAFSRTINLARTYKLSTYDAAYLELAIRSGLPLATLDKDLRKAAKKAEVPVFLQ